MHKKENPQAVQGMGIESLAGHSEEQPAHIVNKRALSVTNGDVYSIKKETPSTNGDVYSIKPQAVTPEAIAGQFALYSTGEAK